MPVSVYPFIRTSQSIPRDPYSAPFGRLGRKSSVSHNALTTYKRLRASVSGWCASITRNLTVPLTLSRGLKDVNYKTENEQCKITENIPVDDTPETWQIERARETSRHCATVRPRDRPKWSRLQRNRKVKRDKKESRGNIIFEERVESTDLYGRLFVMREHFRPENRLSRST